MNQLDFVRIGFRYINLFFPNKHGVKGIEDTNLSITLGGQSIVSQVNLNYNKLHDDMNVAVRIATPGFVTGPLPPDFSLLCDIDLFKIKPCGNFTFLTRLLHKTIWASSSFAVVCKRDLVIFG